MSIAAVVGISLGSVVLFVATMYLVKWLVQPNKGTAGTPVPSDPPAPAAVATVPVEAVVHGTAVELTSVTSGLIVDKQDTYSSLHSNKV